MLLGGDQQCELIVYYYEYCLHVCVCDCACVCESLREIIHANSIQIYVEFMWDDRICRMAIHVQMHQTGALDEYVF